MAFCLKVVLYDCDDFTRKFYLDYLGASIKLQCVRKIYNDPPNWVYWLLIAGVDQFDGRTDVSEKPVTHLKLTPPPHNGIGKERS